VSIPIDGDAAGLDRTRSDGLRCNGDRRLGPSEPRHALHVAQGSGTSIVSQAVQREQMICSVPVGFGQHP